MDELDGDRERAGWLGNRRDIGWASSGESESEEEDPRVGDLGLFTLPKRINTRGDGIRQESLAFSGCKYSPQQVEAVFHKFKRVGELTLNKQGLKCAVIALTGVRLEKPDLRKLYKEANRGMAIKGIDIEGLTFVLSQIKEPNLALEDKWAIITGDQVLLSKDSWQRTLDQVYDLDHELNANRVLSIKKLGEEAFNLMDTHNNSVASVAGLERLLRSPVPNPNTNPTTHYTWTLHGVWGLGFGVWGLGFGVWGL